MHTHGAMSYRKSNVCQFFGQDQVHALFEQARWMLHRSSRKARIKERKKAKLWSKQPFHPMWYKHRHARAIVLEEDGGQVAN